MWLRWTRLWTWLAGTGRGSWWMKPTGRGSLARRGAGVVEQMGLEGRVDIELGTLSKALGSLGGYVATTRVVTT